MSSTQAAVKVDHVHSVSDLIWPMVELVPSDRLKKAVILRACLRTHSIKSLMNEKTIQSIKTPRTMTRLFLVVSLSMTLAASPNSEGQELPIAQGTYIANPLCSEWMKLHERSKTQWAAAFLSTMSMGLNRRHREQKFQVGQDFSKVITAMDTHCAAYPDAQASEAAAPFLE